MLESLPLRSAPLVLVVDDDLTIRLLARQSLELAGFNVAEAEDGIAALTACKTLAPDAVLLDVIMPGKDGFAVCTELRRLPEGKNLPVLMMTGLEDTESINCAYEVGATDFVTKPINWLILGHRVRYMLRASQAFTAIQEGERFLTSIFASIQDGLAILDADFTILRVNPATEQWYAHTGPLVGEKCYQVFQGCAVPCEVCPARRTLEQGVVAHEIEPKIGPTGERTGWLDVYSFPLVDQAGGKIRGVIISLRDITSRIRGEEALRESERRYKTLFHNASDAIFILGPSWRFLEVNRVALEWLGYSRQELLQMTPVHLCPPPYQDQILPQLEQVSLQGQACFETVYQRLDGTAIPIELSCRLIDYGGKPAVLSIARNIAARKEAEEALHHQEEQLHQSQKMEAVGRLAGGVAHDFNNLLTVIMGYCEILEMTSGQSGSFPSEVGQIKKAAEQAAALTRQLLAFSRRQPIEPQALNLDTVVADMEKLLRRLLGENIELKTLPSSSPAQVKADKGQIEQVLMNLAINAADAMPAGGRLDISTENVTLPPGHPRMLPEERTGPYVCLTVADTGVGMDQETRERIFDPFFTTKGPGRGTGLGLSTVYGIIRQHEGWIEVDSEPGMGATFRFYLPVFESHTESLSQEIKSLKKLQGRGERILVVEDESGVRDLAAQGLRENGYEVVTAATAGEAQEILAAANNDFQMIFSDVVLSDLTAVELLDRILPQHPRLRVLLTSGYTDEKSQWPLIHTRGWPFLHKPYSLADLLGYVKAALEPEPQPGSPSGSP